MAHSRRMFLRGAGVALALPFLPSLLDRATRAAAANVNRPRYLAVFAPCGMHLPDWIPEGSGPDWQLSRSLAPLAAYRDRMTVVRGLNATATYSPYQGYHQRECASWLTCTPITPTFDVTRVGNGWSTDQLLADALYADMPWPSTQIGPTLSPFPEDPAKPFAGIYESAVSWRGPVALLGMDRPDAAWRRLLGVRTATSENMLAFERRRGRSVLDRVMSDLSSVRAKVGSSDQVRLDEYLAGVRELERAIDAPLVQNVCELPPVQVDGSWFYPDQVDVMFDLAVRLIECDLTRVASLMINEAGRSRVWRDLGQTITAHEISHHMGDAGLIEQLKQIDYAESQVLQRLLDNLAARSDGDGGSLLDNTVVLYGSGMGDGSAHDPDNIPMLYVGDAGGRLRTGELIDATGRPLADLHLAMLQALGMNLSSFGDSVAPLDGVRV